MVMGRGHNQPPHHHSELNTQSNVLPSCLSVHIKLSTTTLFPSLSDFSTTLSVFSLPPNLSLLATTTPFSSMLLANLLLPNPWIPTSKARKGVGMTSLESAGSKRGQLGKLFEWNGVFVGFMAKEKLLRGEEVDSKVCGKKTVRAGEVFLPSR